MTMVRTTAFVVAALLAAMACPAAASAQEGETVTGAARVIDSDIIMIDKLRVILWGVDAPDRNQTCLLNHQPVDCYEHAFDALDTLAGSGPVTCTLIGDPDPFKRRFGLCKAGDTDINSEMVRQGFAAAYTDQTDAYKAAQDEAAAAKVGLWQDGMEFQEPWVFRQKRGAGGMR